MCAVADLEDGSLNKLVLASSLIQARKLLGRLVIAKRKARRRASPMQSGATDLHF
jgi:hypothetical protein